MSRSLTDLRLVVGLVLGATLTLLVPGAPWQLEWILGGPLLLLLPGYAVVAALFPERPDQPEDRNGSPGWPARFGLSLVGSAVIVAVVGVLLAREGFVRLTIGPAVLLIGVVTLVGVGVAAIRRSPLAAHRHADPIGGVSLGTVTDSFGNAGPQSLALVVSVVVLVSVLGFAGTALPAEPYSEAYLTGGEDTDIAPENATLVAGSDNVVALAIENHEGVSTDYQVVLRLQRTDSDGTVLAQQRLDDFGVSLAANESRVVERSLDPSLTGERLRLQVLIYKGGADGDIGVGTADVSLRLWVTATDGVSG